MKKQCIPYISADMRKEWKMDIEEDQRMGMMRDITMGNITGMRKDIMRESIEDYGLEQHGP
jgi:hypothetical protein